MRTHQYSKSEINSLPTEPGVYKYFNTEEVLIYVGKAKNIKKRVSSYFNRSNQLNRKTQKLVSEIDKIEYVIANSEFDALLLENNLIKANQPKYNILLKDDKTFPYITILNERFPRIISTRKFQPSEGEYFGPYSSVLAMNNVLELLRKLYTIRTCKYNLSEKNIEGGKFKICLEHHIGNCKGPCEGLQEEHEYNQDIEHAKNILKGNLSTVKSFFKENMLRHASQLEFEKAQAFKEKIDLLEKFQSKSMVVNPKITNTDVFTILSDDKHAYINYLKINNGSIILSKTVEVKKKLEEEDNLVLPQIIYELRTTHQSQSKEIITNVPIPEIANNVTNIVPKIGDKKKLIDLSLKNVLFYKKEQISKSSGNKSSNLEILEILQKDLKLPEVPMHIECFDNSNLQGTNPVASMVCFMNGKPAKKQYRHFNIKTVVGPDDFASMYEIVYRRYKRLIEEKKSLPHLIVIDGGKGQLSAACRALKDLGVYGQLPIVGIAKRLEEIYYPEDTLPLHISKKSPSLYLIQKVRDEAHRFAITFHRDKRSQSTFNTDLENIKGIGKATTDALLQKFKSTKKIRDASLEELTALIGKNKASLVKDHFHKD